MKSKKRKRFTLTIASLLAVTTVGITATAISCSYTVITARGSSSVQPFLNGLGEVYSQANDVEIVVNAGGSTNGITWVATGLTQIGTASKDPGSTVTSKNLVSEWKSNEIKTVTLAKDGIAIVFSVPDAYKNDYPVSDFGVDSSNIAELYKAFAGYEAVDLITFYKGTKDVSGVTLGNITAFARTGAAGASGTAEAFYKDSGFSVSGLSDNTKNALAGTINYGSNTKSTSESNAESMQYFLRNRGSNPSMIYLSLGYVANNTATLTSNGLGVLQYKGKSDDTYADASVTNVSNGTYHWVRPFNAMLSINNAEPIKKFIEWVVFKDLEVFEGGTIHTKVFDNQGLIPLTEDEIKNMFQGLTDTEKAMSLADLYANKIDNFWTADYYDADNPTFGWSPE